MLFTMKQTPVLFRLRPRLLRSFNVLSTTCNPKLIENSRQFTSSVNDKISSNPRTFQEIVFNYLHQCPNEKTLNQDSQMLNNGDLSRWDDFFVNRTRGEVQPITTIDPHLSEILPIYINNMKARRISNRLVTVIDSYCHEVLEFESHKDHTLSALKLLNAWLQHFYPQFHRIQELQCYGKLIRQRGREVFQNVSSTNPEDKTKPSDNNSLIHLAFVAGIGKKNLFESHEVLSQLGSLCDTNPEITYLNWNPFDLAIVSVSFFRGGIKMDSERFLSHISESLCQILSKTLAGESKVFNPYVVISLLKMLRQANYVEEKLLRLLSELILSQEHKEKVRNMGFLTNVVSAISGPVGRQLSQPASNLSVDKVLNRMEDLVLEIIRDEEKARRGGRDSGIAITLDRVDSSMKSRLKDISRWFWATASTGYQISPPEAYQADLMRRFFSGEATKRIADALDALLALAIMNHYLDDIVMNVLHSPDIRSALRVKCPQRHKGRFGLFLTSLKIERNDLWRQLSQREMLQLMEIVGPSKSETEGWSCAHLPIMKKTGRSSVHPGIGDYKPHSGLLNQCMDSLNLILSSGENNDFWNDNGSYKNTIDASSSRDEYLGGRDGFSQIQVLQGYAVPYLHIPGIKVILQNVGKELYVEVIEEETISPGLHQFKLRLMSQMGFVVLRVTREEITNCPNVPAYLKFNVLRALNL